MSTAEAALVSLPCEAGVGPKKIQNALAGGQWASSPGSSTSLLSASIITFSAMLLLPHQKDKKGPTPNRSVQTQVYSEFVSPATLNQVATSTPDSVITYPHLIHRYSTYRYSRISSKYIVPVPPAAGTPFVPKPMVMVFTLARLTP
jgi:hypothetical protein